MDEMLLPVLVSKYSIRCLCPSDRGQGECDY